MTKVSIIMPVYNGEDYLAQSIESVLSQTLDDFELICVDDGSTDGSLEILNGFAENDSRIRVFHQQNSGGGAARNFAMRHATGKYLYCMDADDLIKRTALEELYCICEEKRLDMVIFQAVNYDEDAGEYYRTRYYDMTEFADFAGDRILGCDDLGDMMFKINVTPWCKLYNLEFVKRSGAQFAEGLIFHDNVFFWEAIFNAERIYFLRQCLYARRRHSASSTCAGDRRFVSAITIHNMIIGIFMKYGKWDQYKCKLYNRKIRLLERRFDEVADEFKEFFFCEMKRDFHKIIGHERYDEFMECVNRNNKRRFMNVIESKSYDEFLKKRKALELEIRNAKKKQNKSFYDSATRKLKRGLRRL